MRFIPTFILEHWIYDCKIFELFVVAGRLYGRNLPKVDEETKIYEFDLANGKWIDFPKEKP